MTRGEFTHFQRGFMEQCVQVAKSKGNEYSGLEDTHANFKRLADKLGLTKEKVLMVYLAKHMDSIDSFIRNGCDEAGLTEPIQGRILDAVNYLTLLAAMFEPEDLSEQMEFDMLGV